jgi:hypothetical protein
MGWIENKRKKKPSPGFTSLKKAYAYLLFALAAKLGSHLDPVSRRHFVIPILF